MTKIHTLIELLADGKFHSGESLGESLQVTRAAVWKHVQSLEKYGLDVFAVRGQGYRLSSPITLLDVRAIQSVLSKDVAKSLDSIDVLAEVDSTNNYLRKTLTTLRPGHGRVCLTEWQKEGKGRRGRHWVSAYASGLCLSLAWNIDQSNFPLGGLSLAVAVAVIRALAKSGVADLRLKWPNDIYLNGAKLAGILIEMTGETGGSYRVVIGVGVNINMSERVATQIDQPCAAVNTGTRSVDRNKLAGLIVNETVDAIRTFSECGLEAFIKEWDQYDLTMGQQIELRRGGDIIRGRGKGIDANGALLIEYNGGVKSFHAGEVSVRLSP